MLHTLTSIAKFTYGASFIIAEAVTDAFVANEAIELLTGKKNDENIDTTTYISLAFTVLAAVPVAITVTHYLFKKLTGGHQHHHDEEQHGHKHEHHHSLPQEIGEFVIIGIPFGLLTFGGSNYFLSKLINKTPSYVLSSLLGLVSATGNWALHSSHIHAEEGFVQLFRRIPTARQRIKAVMFAISILGGHFLQGFLDGMLLLKSIEKQDYHPALTYGLSFGLATLITLFEGNTEMRSTLLNETLTDTQKVMLLTKIAVSIASGIHALQPTLGLPELFDFIYGQVSDTHSLKAEAPLWSKLLLLSTSGILIGIPNLVGIYNTTLTSCDKALNKVGKLISSCGFFKHKTTKLDEESFLINSTPTLKV